MEIFILAGEPSGEMHGAKLAEELFRQHPGVRISGTGGARMRNAGVELFDESDHWGAIGIYEALQRVPHLYAIRHKLLKLWRKSPPDALVLIDFGAFNVRLLNKIKGLDIPTVYFIPPGCWSRTRPAGHLPFMVDAIATPFSWSADNLRAAGAPCRVEWVGHPLKEYCSPVIPREEAIRQLGLDTSRPIIGIVPGSRRSELRHIFPALLQAARIAHPASQCLIAVAPSLGGDALREMMPPGLDFRLLDGIDYNLMQAADAALVTSGTATLEMANLDIPMVVAYRGGFMANLQYIAMKIFCPIGHISLPNILLDAAIVPELKQHDATPEALAAALLPLLTPTPQRRAQIAAFARVRETLGDGNAIKKTAQLVRDIANSRN